MTYTIRMTKAMRQAILRGDKTETRRCTPSWAKVKAGDKLRVLGGKVTLVATEDARTERLHALTEGAALREGVMYSPTTHQYLPGGHDYASWAFRELWNGINGDKPGRAWDDNPEVVVLTFRVDRVEQGWPRGTKLVCPGCAMRRGGKVSGQAQLKTPLEDAVGPCDDCGRPGSTVPSHLVTWPAH